MRFYAKEEGAQREWIAAYLLCTPPLERQTPKQKRQTRRVLACLWRLESESVRKNSGQPRRLTVVEGGTFLRRFFRRSQQLLQTQSSLRLITPLVCPPFLMLCEPRVLQIGLVALLRDLAQSGSVTVLWNQTPKQVSLSFCFENGHIQKETVLLLKETARLHHGSLAVYAHKIQLSLPLAFCGVETEKIEEIHFDDLLSIPSIGLRFF